MPTQIQVQAQIAANNSAVAGAQTLPELIQTLGVVDPALAQRISGFTSLGDAKVWGPTAVAGLMYLSGRFGLGLSDTDCSEIAGALGLVASALLHKYEVRVHLVAQAQGQSVAQTQAQTISPRVASDPDPSPPEDFGGQPGAADQGEVQTVAQAVTGPLPTPFYAGPSPAPAPLTGGSPISGLASISDMASALQNPQTKS